MIIHEPFLTSSIGGDTLKTNFSGSAYLGYQSTSSNATASNEFVIGNGLTGLGNDSVKISNKFSSTISASYIGHNANSSSAGVSNEIVVGINVTGSGANTATLGNENTTATHLFGSLYRTQFVTSSITASKFKAYALSGSGYTFHLPASPNPGDSLKISNFQTNVTGSARYSTEITASERITIGRSGEAIMGYTESMDLDIQSPTFEMIYIDSTRGWVIFGSR